MKYRNRPVVVDAVQWFKHGDHPAVTYAPSGWFSHRNARIIGWIKKEIGGVLVYSGDWVVTDERGDMSTMNPGSFAATHERIEE